MTFHPAVTNDVANVPPPRYPKLEYAADTPCLTRTRIVYLDPGHGGEGGHGCRAYNGKWEKDANLALALEVKAHLEEEGVEVKMTRETDAEVPLYERARDAHKIKAACFVSIHYNAPAASKDPLTVRYRSVYSWNDLGKKLADSIAEAYAPCESLHANFAVTRSPEIPSCLVEADFLTHPDGCRDAFDPTVRDQVASQIAAGILNFLLDNQ